MSNDFIHRKHWFSCFWADTKKIISEKKEKILKLLTSNGQRDFDTTPLRQFSTSSFLTKTIVILDKNNQQRNVLFPKDGIYLSIH